MPSSAQLLATEQRKANRERLELTLLQQVRAMKLPEPKRNHRFYPTRKWEFDFAWVAIKFAVEVQGGTYCGGKHVRGIGYTLDCRKIGEAMTMGWTVYCCDSKLIESGEALDMIIKLFEVNGWGIFSASK